MFFKSKIQNSKSKICVEIRHSTVGRSLVAGVLVALVNAQAWAQEPAKTAGMAPLQAEQELLLGVKHAEQELRTVQIAHRPDEPEVAIAQTELAALYHAYGKYADAEALYKRVLGTKEKLVGRDHPDVARALVLLASLYETQQRYGEAEPLLKRAVDIVERTLGRDHPMAAHTLERLAWLYRQEGRRAEAAALLERALVIREVAFGMEHEAVGRTLDELATTYSDDGRLSDAEPHFKRAQDIYQKTLGLDHPLVARLLEHYAAALHGNPQREEEARTLADRAERIRTNWRITHGE